jgi:hypothetical protein
MRIGGCRFIARGQPGFETPRLALHHLEAGRTWDLRVARSNSHEQLPQLQRRLAGNRAHDDLGVPASVHSQLLR